MSELAPGWALHEEESTQNHWVGACRELVMLFAYEGSHEDPRHVHAGARLIERLAGELGPIVKLLFVVPPLHSKPPDARVRGAIVQAARRLEGRVSRVSVVVAGTGFGAAVHRGAATGVLALLRPRVPVKVHASVRDGLAHLLSREHEALAPLVRCCEERMLGPAARPR